MIGKVWKTGNSLVVSIPAHLATIAQLKRDDLIEIRAVGDGKIEIAKVEFSNVAPDGAGKAAKNGESK